MIYKRTAVCYINNKSRKDGQNMNNMTKNRKERL